MKPRSIPTADDTVIRHVQIADGICRFSLFDWARANGVKPANAEDSFSVDSATSVLCAIRNSP